MSAYEKGSIDFAALIIVIGIAAAVVSIMEIPFFYHIFTIKSRTEVYMSIDDRGSEIVSLLNSRRNGTDTEEILGILLAEPNSDSKESLLIKNIMDRIYSDYSLALSGPYGSVNIGKGIIKTGDINPEGCGMTIEDRDVSLDLPLKGEVNVSSGFGYRERPKGKCDCHGGVDFAVAKGTPVYASADGTVWRVAYNPGGYGKYVVLSHDFGGKVYYTIYADLSEIKVEKGDVVKRGEMIGLSGNSGSGEYQLHFEVRKDVNGGFGVSDIDSVNPCPLFRNAPEGCVHESVDVCRTIQLPAEDINSAGADIPLPGAVEGKIKGRVELKRWNIKG